jgi:cell division septum initiation protein DivIVA
VDEDLEAMQGTVYLLQQELKDAKERISSLQQEIDQLKDASSGHSERGDRPPGDRKPQIADSTDAAPADKKDHKTGAVADARSRPGQNCGQVAAAAAAADDRHAAAAKASLLLSSSSSSCDQTRHSKSASALDGGRNCEKMEIDDDGDCDERRNSKQRCFNASRTSSTVVGVSLETNAAQCGAALPSADSMAVDDGPFRSTEGTDAYRTAAGKVGGVERDYALSNGTDDDSRRAAVTE